jgi:isoleucyl-tRNA synthetase
LSAREIRRHAKEYAIEQVANQKKEFMGLGIMGDWAHPYLTLGMLLDCLWCVE